MGFTIVSVKEVSAPFKQSERFSASVLLFCQNPNNQTTDCILLLQRARFGQDENGQKKENSWALSWEPPGGGYEPTDSTLLETAIRETKEETGLEVQPSSHEAYKETFVHKGMRMTRYTIIADVDTNHGSIKLRADEHLAFHWATEEEVRNSLPYDDKNFGEGPLVMLPNKKDMILDAFEKRKVAKETEGAGCCS